MNKIRLLSWDAKIKVVSEKEKHEKKKKKRKKKGYKTINTTQVSMGSYSRLCCSVVWVGARKTFKANLSMPV